MMDWRTLLIAAVVVQFSGQAVASGARPQSLDRALLGVSTVVVAEILHGESEGHGDLLEELAWSQKTYSVRRVSRIEGESPDQFEVTTRSRLAVGGRYVLLMRNRMPGPGLAVLAEFQLAPNPRTAEFDRVMYSDNLIVMPRNLTPVPFMVEDCTGSSNAGCRSVVVYSFVPLTEFVTYLRSRMAVPDSDDD
jgi:hypothetical protein